MDKRIALALIAVVAVLVTAQIAACQVNEVTLVGPSGNVYNIYFGSHSYGSITTQTNSGVTGNYQGTIWSINVASAFTTDMRSQLALGLASQPGVYRSTIATALYPVGNKQVAGGSCTIMASSAYGWGMENVYMGAFSLGNGDVCTFSTIDNDKLCDDWILTAVA